MMLIMNGHATSALRAAIGLLFVGLVSGCWADAPRSSGGVGTSPTPTQSKPTAPADALQLIASGATYEMAAKPGEVIYDGVATVQNAADVPIEITAVAPSNSAGDAFELISVQLVALKESDSGVGLLRMPPQQMATHLKPLDLSRVQLSPGVRDRYVLLLMIRAVKAGLWKPDQLHVTYKLGGTAYTTDLAHHVVICVDGASTAEC